MPQVYELSDNKVVYFDCVTKKASVYKQVEIALNQLSEADLLLLMETISKNKESGAVPSFHSGDGAS